MKVINSGIYLILAFILFSFIATPSFAQDFTAKTVGDYGNVTVMEVTGNYDESEGDEGQTFI